MNRAIESCNSFLSMITESRRIYEIQSASGSNIHNFNNMYQTVYARINLLMFQINHPELFSMDRVDHSFKVTRQLVNDFVCYVGTSLIHRDLKELYFYGED